MTISEVSINNLRATKLNKIKLSPGINLLYGNNGVGKTTILETIYLLAYGKSFKTQKTQTIIGNIKKISGGFLKTTKDNILKIKFFNNKKTLTLDNIKVSKISEHIHFLPCIVFSPDETTLEGKQNSPKQKNINKVLCLIDLKYLTDLKKYNTTLKQRNSALRKGKGFEIWEKPLASLSESVWEKRKDYVEKINTRMDKINIKNNTTFKTKIDIKLPKTTSKEALKSLIESREKDVFTKRTNTGPHVDKIEYLINQKTIKTKASQGEKNIFFSILKKAESEIIKKETNKDPIVLLDDVFSKLDKDNIFLVLNLFKNHPQTIITHTNKIEIKGITQIKING